ncbi:glycosyltransferase family 2 protein [Vibrio sp. 1CM2L]|uniref:glycosyltransferase family 2 protein n=1 Tax=Vibrio sp. 1CM2L TaxID=2929166 RepID=UPI0020BE89F6|nr:glycosyltransferase family 2 protein [Vibrio sp. 1CM2L]MCK8078714.1 glycosyltransferase family 2 protein [Vibrio sp. 1CM2L]
MKKISIIIPTYNSSEYIKCLLDSIPISNNEVIIVDDYSQDLMELRRIATSHPNVRVLSNDRKKGAGSCRNIGIHHAQGDFLVFADSDDYFSSNIVKVFSNIESFIPKSCDVAYFKPSSVSLNNDVSNRHKTYEALVDLHIKNDLDYVRYWFHVPWSKIIRRDFVVKNKLKFSETLVSNDVIFSLSVGIKARNIICHSLAIYTVVERSGSLTQVVGFDVLSTRLSILREYNSILNANGLARFSIPEFVYLIKMFRLNPKKTLKLMLESKNLLPNFTYFKSRLLIKSRM